MCFFMLRTPQAIVVGLLCLLQSVLQAFFGVGVLLVGG